MPIKCLVDLVTAIDDTPAPPLSDEELASWVNKWRKKETALYENHDEGERCANLNINAQLIACIVELIPIRKESRQLGHPRQAYPGRRHKLGRCNQAKDHALSIGVSSVEKWGLRKFASCDASPGKEGLLIVFREDGGGEHAVNLGKRPPYYIWFKRKMDAMEYGDGNYMLLPVDVASGSFILTPRD